MVTSVFVVFAAHTHLLEVLRQVLKPTERCFLRVPKFLHFVFGFSYPIVFFGGSVAICPNALDKEPDACGRIVFVVLFAFADLAQCVSCIIDNREFRVNLFAASVDLDSALE